MSILPSTIPYYKLIAFDKITNTFYKDQGSRGPNPETAPHSGFAIVNDTTPYSFVPEIPENDTFEFTI